jgi:acetyl esterase
MLSVKLHLRASLFLLNHHLNPFTAVNKMPILMARNSYEMFSKIHGGTAQALHEIKNKVLTFQGLSHSIPIRIYQASSNKSPLLIYFHGGGWSLGSLNTHDTLCRSLAKTSECTVVSVAYRLAPEVPYPAAIEDASLVYDWCHKHADILNIHADKIAVGGDSSGGNIAAVLAAECIEENKPIPTFQMLLYPTLDLSLNQQSMTDLGKGHFLTKDEMIYYRSNYAPNLDVMDWRLSPLYYPLLSKVPATIILTAECDPLRDDGKLYAQGLIEQGVSVDYQEIPGMIHSFMQMPLMFPTETSISLKWLAINMKKLWRL